MKTLILSTLIFVSFSFNSFAQNWFPLEVGNIADFQKYGVTQPFSGFHVWVWSFTSFQVTDSIIIDGKKYYYSNGFFNFPNGSLIRYDPDSSKLFVIQDGTEYLYMDFLLPENSVLSQIQPDNTLHPITIVSKTANIFGETVLLKGFNRIITSSTLIETFNYYFAPGLGMVKENQYTIAPAMGVYKEDSTDIIECRYFDSLGNIFHKKHSYSANIQFNPITYLNFGENLQQEFKITHPLSVWGFPAAFVYGRKYLSDVFLDYYYSDGIDSGYNGQYPIDSLSEIDFSLNYSVDTLKYINGYSLYYRIVAKDKGIVPSYYYKPINGYYKLVYNPSDVDEEKILSNEFVLHQNYPNPFNPGTSIQYSISSRQFVTLKVYDVLSNEVATLVNEEKAAGNYDINFNASKFSSGIYFYQLRAGEFVETKKMILIK